MKHEIEQICPHTLRYTFVCTAMNSVTNWSSRMTGVNAYPNVPKQFGEAAHVYPTLASLKA